jgi:hypothetical protein
VARVGPVLVNKTADSTRSITVRGDSSRGDDERGPPRPVVHPVRGMPPTLRAAIVAMTTTAADQSPPDRYGRDDGR